MPALFEGQLRTDLATLVVEQERIFPDDARKTFLDETEHDDEIKTQPARASSRRR